MKNKCFKLDKCFLNVYFDRIVFGFNVFVDCIIFDRMDSLRFIIIIGKFV